MVRWPVVEDGHSPTEGVSMTQGHSEISPGRWRIQILSTPPRLFGMGEAVPQTGWAVQEETSVFKDGQVVGLFASLSSRPDTSQWNLRYEWIEEGPGAKLVA